jgi:guanosine-3',5'-bis(diphosphate) 3'-pyrophosphohydrolase
MRSGKPIKYGMATERPLATAGDGPDAAARFRELERVVHAARPGDDLNLLRRAFDFSARTHIGQMRKSGDAFIVHPLEVAFILADLRMDVSCIAAGLLHDAVEDTPITSEDIEREFGPVIAHLVEGVTKIDRLDFVSQGARQAENVRKMLLAMVDDIRVILIKLADRLHNMRTLRHLSEDRQRAIAQETMDIYAPLAHRLGMGKMRGELEDLAFSYIEPAAYQQVHDAIEKRRAVNEHFLVAVQQQIHDVMRKHEIKCRVEGRIKRFYSIWQKLQRQRVDLDQVYDLLAVRLLTGSVKDCYAALGVIHNTWHPVPGRIKDFIAIPRPNGYQSLHTSVIHESGQPFEVQIRTEEMHRVAEEGIAAHWKYKAGATAPDSDDERIAWLRQIVEWQREMRDPGEFLSTLKVDLYPEEVYAFTPKGRIITLPRESSTVDFAYAIHTEVGHQCVGAKVNGRIVPLRYRIQNGDIVEILTQTGHTPSRDWLVFVKSQRARQKIRHWLNVAERARALEIGRRLLEREGRRYDISLKRFKEEDYVRVGQEYGLTKSDDVYAAIGYGKISARQVLGRLLPAGEREGSGLLATTPRRPPLPQEGGPILVRGFNDLMVYRARCCSPIHGEPIVGYITRGKGVAVHSESCPNVQNLMYEPDRRIEVQWAARAEEAQPVKLSIHTDDRAGMLNAITSVISENGSNIRQVGAHTGEGMAVVEVVVDIADLKQLDRIINGVKRIPGVHDVQRIQRV